MLLCSLANINHEFSDVMLLLLGDGDRKYVDHLKKLCRKYDIKNKVVFHSSVPRLELPQYFSASDIAVWVGSPSISIAEAASSGLPIIIAKSPFTSYLTSNNNGLLINSGDCNDLKMKLETLIKNEKLRNEMGYQSRQLIETQLNWSIITEKFLKDCKKVLIDHYYL